MVLEENTQYHEIAKFVSHFLKRNATKKKIANEPNGVDPSIHSDDDDRRTSSSCTGSDDSVKTDAIVQRLLKEWKSQAVKNALRGILKRKTSKSVKRLSSKYIYYCAVERETIRAQNPTMNIKDVTCEMGRRWKQFLANPDPDRMRDITEAYERDRERYYDNRSRCGNDQRNIDELRLRDDTVVVAN